MSSVLENKPEVGDRIEFKRNHYSHWGIYIGNDQIIHMRGTGNKPIGSNSGNFFSIFGEMFDKAEVGMDFIWDVIKGGEAYINNSRDSTWKVSEPQEIVKKAKEHLGERVEYNIIYANCENFTNWCRYEKWESDQVDNVIDNIAVTGAVAGVVSITSFVLYALARYEKNKNKPK